MLSVKRDLHYFIEVFLGESKNPILNAPCLPLVKSQNIIMPLFIRFVLGQTPCLPLVKSQNIMPLFTIFVFRSNPILFRFTLAPSGSFFSKTELFFEQIFQEFVSQQNSKLFLFQKKLGT
jgi:hypothetical protein